MLVDNKENSYLRRNYEFVLIKMQERVNKLNQLKLLNILVSFLIVIGAVMFIIHSFLGYLFFFCGAIVGGVQEYMKKHKISAYILFGISILIIFAFVWEKFWLHKFEDPADIFGEFLP